METKIKICKKEDFEKPNWETNKIGEGGYGTVFKLQEFKTGNYYAVKMLKENNLYIARSFFQEITVLSNLHYPTILNLYGVNLEPPYYMITEYYPNKTVQDHINKSIKGGMIEKWDLAHKMIIILGISFGMKYLHSMEIVHRDLKPGNVLLDSNYYPKICDFGLSKSIIDSNTMTTLIGTTLYAAPEIENSNYDAKKADVYSFGMTIYSILYDRIPFSGMSPYQVYKKVKSGERPQFKPKIISKSMKKLIKSCWEKDPNLRPSFFKISKELMKEQKEIKGIEERKEIEEFLKYCQITEEDFETEEEELNNEEIDKNKND